MLATLATPPPDADVTACARAAVRLVATRTHEAMIRRSALKAWGSSSLKTDLTSG